MAPGGSQEAHFENFAPSPPKGSRRLILSIFVPWPPNGPRKPPEGSSWAFSCLGREMAPGAPQKAHFGHFHALATKWPKETPRRLILACSGLFWHILAYYCLFFWPILTYSDLFLLILAYFDLFWSILASSGIFWPNLAYSGVDLVFYSSFWHVVAQITRVLRGLSLSNCNFTRVSDMSSIK